MGLNTKNETEAARRAVVAGGSLKIIRPPAGTVSEVRGPKPKKAKKAAAPTAAAAAAEEPDDGDE